MAPPRLLLYVLTTFLHQTVTAGATPAQWTRLNNTVQGRLYLGRPLALPCYSLYEGSPSPPNAAACQAVQNGYETDEFIAGYYSGFMNTNWATCQANGSSCNLDYTTPSNPLVYGPPNVCRQGSISPYYIDVRTVSDVQAGLKFAQDNNVPLTIKNTGHDYKGRSSAPGSLALWTHNVQPAIKLTRNFRPDGCSASGVDAVTFGAGQGFKGLYDFGEANNVTIVGGSSQTVGAAGGWITGAGHSALSNTLGLGVDNVLQLKAVLPNGNYVTANACQNPDIFFALRGGGGSTFGVIMEMTTRAHPRLELQIVHVSFASLDLTYIQRFLTLCIQQASTWSDGGWGGYIVPGALGTSTLGGIASGMILMTPKLTLSQAKAQMKPLTDFVASLPLTLVLNNNVTTTQSYGQAYNTFIVPGEEKVGLGTAIGSRLIPRSQFAGTANQTALANTLLKISDMLHPVTNLLSLQNIGYGYPLQILVTAPSSYTVPKTGAQSAPSAATPAWRNSLWHIFVNSVFSNQASASDINAAFQLAHDATEMLKALTPGSGAYQNEADTFQTDHEATFWGLENHARLLTLKKKLDPKNVLTCHQCVGWNASDAGRYGCYPSVK